MISGSKQKQKYGIVTKNPKPFCYIPKEGYEKVN